MVRHFATLGETRPSLRRLRWTRSLVIRHLCLEDRVVLRAEGFSYQHVLDYWLVWRRA